MAGKRIMKPLALIPCALLLASCATQFVVIQSEWRDDILGREILDQAILIINPPRNTERLVEMIEEYNRRTISYWQIREHNVGRRFYRRSWFLRRDFEAGKPYPMLFGDLWFGDVQCLSHHPVLVRTWHTRDIHGRFRYHISTPKGRHPTRTIYDPKNYFLGE